MSAPTEPRSSVRKKAKLAPPGAVASSFSRIVSRITNHPSPGKLVLRQKAQPPFQDARPWPRPGLRSCVGAHRQPRGSAHLEAEDDAAQRPDEEALAVGDPRDRVDPVAARREVHGVD